MFPRNWGKTKHEDRQKVPKAAEFMSLSEASNRRGQGSRSRPVVNSPIVDALRTAQVVDPLLIPYEGIPHDVWIQTTGSASIWITKPNRTANRIRDIHRRFIRQTIRSFHGYYKMGRQTGRVGKIRIFANSVEVDFIPASESDPELKVALLAFLKSILGDDNLNEELQHFYNMIQESTEVNFWLLEYHRILMSIRERYYLPTDCRLGLQEIEDWEKKFDNYLRLFIGSADCAIKNQIYQPRHEDFITVYNRNDNRNPDKGFLDNYVGLLRFVRALVFHGADPGRDLPWEDVERELSNRFPQMLIQLFGFLFKTMSENDLSFLVDRRSSVPGDD